MDGLDRAAVGDLGGQRPREPRGRRGHLKNVLRARCPKSGRPNPVANGHLSTVPNCAPGRGRRLDGAREFEPRKAACGDCLALHCSLTVTRRLRAWRKPGSARPAQPRGWVGTGSGRDGVRPVRGAGRRQRGRRLPRTTGYGPEGTGRRRGSFRRLYGVLGVITLCLLNDHRCC